MRLKLALSPCTFSPSSRDLPCNGGQGHEEEGGRSGPGQEEGHEEEARSQEVKRAQDLAEPPAQLAQPEVVSRGMGTAHGCEALCVTPHQWR